MLFWNDIFHGFCRLSVVKMLCILFCGKNYASFRFNFEQRKYFVLKLSRITFFD